MYYCPFRHFPRGIATPGFVRLACLIHAANVRSEPGSNPSQCVLSAPGCPGVHERKKLDVRRLGIDSLNCGRETFPPPNRRMSDAKLASTHPRKARNTQLVKDPDKTPDARSEALPPGCRSSVVGFRVSPFQTTSTYYRGHPGCQASRPNFWETALKPPE